MARAFAGAEIEVALIPQVTSFTAETGLIPAGQKRFAEGKTDLAVAPDLPEKERLFAKKLCSEHYCLVTPKSVASQDEMPLSAILPYLTLASQIFLQCLKTKWTREMVLVKPAVSHFLSFEPEA